MNETDRIAAMAYADGEMAPDERTAFEDRLAHEPALASAVAREHALRARLASAHAVELEEPVPAALLDLLAVPDSAPSPAPLAANDGVAAGANDAHRAALPPALRWAWPQLGAMAACLVLGVLLGARLLPSHSETGSSPLALAIAKNGAVTAQGALRDALDQHVAGTVLDPNASASVGLTFRNRARQYCRTFTLDNATSGIACRQPDGWVVAHLEHAANAPARAAGGYRQAASPYSPTLLQAIDAMREGDTLDAAGEAAAKAGGWKP